MPPAKVGKVSRSHEENQERAYVAASRRSDRSLEARVESARRASEIHKRRTGRALRVTERDVANEEMYEEEEEDFSAQYRKLAVHLQTGSVDFNKRLQNYLGTQVGIRSAMINANAHGNIHPQQQHPNAYAQVNNSPMIQAPMGMNQIQMSQMQMQQPNSQPMYSQGPYFQQWQQNIPPRSQATPPAQLDSPLSYGNNIRSQTPTSFSPFIQSPMPTNQSYPQYGPSYGGQLGQSNNYSPFSTALPANAQQLLGNTLDGDHPYSSELMSGSHQSQTWGFQDPAQGSTHVEKQYSTAFQSQGLNATLASSNMGESLDNLGSVNSAQSPDHDQMAQPPFEPLFAEESEFNNFDDYCIES